MKRGRRRSRTATVVIHPLSRRRSRHREIIFHRSAVGSCGRCRSRTRTLARHPVFGTGVCTTQTSPSRSTRGGNRTRPCALKERRPRPLDHASSVPPAGFEPAHRASEARVTSPYGGEIETISSCSSPGNRTPPSGLEDPSPIHRPSHRAASIGRESNPRFALCRRAPCHLATDAQSHGGEDRNRTGRSRIASAARPLGTCLPVKHSGPDEDRTRLVR